MPGSEPYTPGEVARSFDNFGKALVRIETKLDSRPDWEDINRITAAQIRIDANQDDAIKALEDGMNRMLLTVLGTAAGAVVSLVVALSSGG